MSKLLAGIGITWIFLIITSVLCFQIADIQKTGTVYATPVGEVSLPAAQPTVSLQTSTVNTQQTAAANAQQQASQPAVTQPAATQQTAVSSGSSSTRNSAASYVRNLLNPNRNSNKVSEGVKDALESDGSARVVVSFSEPEHKDAVLAVAESMGAETNVEWSNGASITADSNTINTIVQNNAVESIENDLPLHTMTYEGFDLIDLEKTLVDGRLALNDPYATPATSRTLAGTGNLNLTGKNQAICVIDSGIDNNPEFEGRLIAEWDFYGNDAFPGDDWNHGTRMAGIIAAKGVKMQGIAYEADIINLRITNESGESWNGYLQSALDWCLSNASKYNITAVYIGVGMGIYDGSEAPCNGATASKINNLTNNNITVIAPAGHNSNTTRISFPACIANTISVGGVPDGTSGLYPADTWDLGGIQSNRRNGLLDLLAPGGDGRTQTTNVPPNPPYNYTDGTGVGTSVSAAYVAGASLLLREYWDANDWNFRPAGLVNGNIPNTIEYIFKQTGKQIEDELNPGVYYPRLDFYKAVNYEENPPVIALETANGSTVTEGSINFGYNVNDQHSVANCSLFINGSKDQDDVTITEGVTQTFTKTLSAGTYSWKVECYDDSTFPNKGISETRTINVQATWTCFGIPYDNISVCSSHGSCTAPDFCVCSGGWMGPQCSTPPAKTPSTATLAFNTTSPQPYGTVITATCTDTNPEDTAKMYRDGVDITSESGVGVTLAAGTYNYVCNVSETANYLGDEDTASFIINKVETVISLDISPALWNISQGAQTQVSCSVEDPNNAVLKLYRDGVEVSQPDIQTLAAGTYAYVCNTTGNQNYTSDEVSNTLTVNPGADTTPPVISNVQNSSITNDSITITWDTDENANSSINYGLDTDLGTLFIEDLAYTDSHIVHLTGLQPDTIYYYNVTSCDTSGNCATKGPFGWVRTLANPNDVPVLAGIPDNETDEDVTPAWQIDLRSYTVDDQPLANGDYDVLSQTNSALIDCYISGNQYLVCDAPAADQSGFSDILIRYEDEFSQHDNDTVRITVNPVNDAPVLNAIADIVVNEGDTVQINPSATDVDLDSLNYAFTSPVNSTGGWKTVFTDAGVYNVNVSVSDGNGGVDSQVVQITVNNVLVPDLRIKYFLQQSPRNAVANDFVMLSFVIENIGEAVASSVDWVLDFGNSDSASGTISSLSAGSESSIMVRKTNYTSSNNYTAVLSIDGLDAIAELDETNNNRNRTVSVS